MTCNGTINVVSSCVPNWICDAVAGYENDGCGNKRTTTSCSNASAAFYMIRGDIPVDLRYDVSEDGVVNHDDVNLLINGAALLPYREAYIALCSFPTGDIVEGNTVDIPINIYQGTITENFVLQLRGSVSQDYSLSVNYGLSTESVTITTPPLTTVGVNNLTITLVLV